ncbi:MAG: hypothetical protein GKR88_11495 [Flavobacteriaceae bacterium]|nr:MAG: hypothetical protein GKR88_11495 [Flavobacteriaceae bacterium]
MKKYFLFVALVSFFCCKKEIKSKQSNEIVLIEQKLNNNIDDLLIKSKNYVPNQIDLSEIDFLENFNIASIFNDKKNDKSKKDLIVNYLFLKQYLYHLKKANQGYNLYSMKKGKAKFLIEYFLQSNNIAEHSEGFINSAVAYNVLKKDKSITNSDILSLISKIEAENKRINEQSKKIINN